jgi:hypothetical protein
MSELEGEPEKELEQTLLLIGGLRLATQFRYRVVPLAFTRAVMLVSPDGTRAVAKIVCKDTDATGRALVDVLLVEDAPEPDLEHLRGCMTKVIQAILRYVYGGDDANCTIISWSGGKL